MVPPFIARFFKSPTWIVWLFLLVGLVLPFFPYFRAIDYPLSLALTIVAALVAPLWGRFALLRAEGVAKEVGRVAGLSLLAVAAGAIPAGVASAFTDVCEPDYGLLFLLMGPVSTIFVGGLVGLGLAHLKVGWKSSVAILAGLVLGSWLLVLGELLWSPGVRFYGTFFGLYHGAIYDEGVFVDAPYFWLRLKDLVFVLAGVSYFWGRGSEGVVRRKAFLVPLLGAVVLLGLGPRLGFVSTAFPLEAELSLQVQLNGVVLRATPGGRAEKRLERLADEVQFRRYQVMELFELTPDEAPEVTVFVYDSPWQKERLMGAHRTSITKPWRREIHIHAHETPNSLIAHELVHALLSKIPDSPLGIPARLWLLPEAGLIEGAAVAVERAGGRYTTHEWARAVRDLGLRPPLPDLMKGMAFWSYPGPVAYNTCGSFVRFLLERYGGSSFKKVYGGASWSQAYGKSLETLAAEWDGYLDQLEVDAGAMEYARFLFSQKSVFERSCPYVGGRCLKRAYMAASSGDVPALFGATKMGLRATNEEPNLARAFVDLAIIVGELELARDLWVAAFLRGPTCDSVSGPWSLVDCRFSQALGAVVLMRWGDLLWLAGEDGKAAEVYETLWEGESRQVLEHVLSWRLQLVSTGDLDEDSRRLVCGLWHPRESDGLFRALLERTGEGQEPEPLTVLLGLTLLKRPDWTLQGLSLLSHVDLDKAVPEAQRVDVLLEVAYGHYFAGDLKGAGEYLEQCGRLKTSRLQEEAIADLAQRRRWHTSGVSLHPSNPVVENQE